MNLSHEYLKDELADILKKSIETHQTYYNASKMAKEDEVKLFFKNKANNWSLFNEKLKSVGISISNNIDISSNNIENDSVASVSNVVEPCEEILLMQSLKRDKQLLKDFNLLLKESSLPLSIRFIIKEQIVFIRLDALKIEQLILAYR
jgi:hypothetical protein